MPLNLPAKWDISLSAWIIQDGNYPDFEVGQTAEFALEFWLPEGVAARGCSEGKAINKVGDYLYDTVAEVVLQTDNITILDIGVLVYSESSSELRLALLGEPRVAVQLGLGVDPFSYFERLSKFTGVPPLIYSWKVLSILRQTAPFVQV